MRHSLSLHGHRPRLPGGNTYDAIDGIFCQSLVRCVFLSGVLLSHGPVRSLQVSYVVGSVCFNVPVYLSCQKETDAQQSEPYRRASCTSYLAGESPAPENAASEEFFVISDERVQSKRGVHHPNHIVLLQCGGLWPCALKKRSRHSCRYAVLSCVELWMYQWIHLSSCENRISARTMLFLEWLGGVASRGGKQLRCLLRVSQSTWA